ncbi:MAG: sigma factor [Abditibacteriales bacterium]|nr:sigma factor [Abditibacteriales bacterium]
MALDIFTSAEEDAAWRAWERLRTLSQRYLWKCLREWGCYNPDDQQDVIHNAFLRIWNARTRFQNKGVAAWRAYVKMTAHRCFVDQWREKQRVPLVEGEEGEDWDWSQVRDEEMPDVVSLINSLLGNELFHCANVLWLGLDPTLPAEVHHRQLLAAQLYYLDGDSWEQVCDTLPSLTRETLDAWLSHAGVIRYLAYQEIYYSNESLARHLLGAPAADLDELMRQATYAASEAQPPPGWTWDAVKVILWRYRNGLTVDQILQRLDCPYSREDLQALLDRLTALLPFSSQMVRVLSALDRAPGLDARSVLGGRGLWQRLVFQYRYGDDLPHRDIQERTQPAAEHVGYEVRLDVLNVWLSGGRLLRQLAEFYRQVRGEIDDE